MSERYYAVIGHLEGAEPQLWHFHAHTESDREVLAQFVRVQYNEPQFVKYLVTQFGRPMTDDEIVRHWQSGKSMTELGFSEIHIDFVLKSDSPVHESLVNSTVWSGSPAPEAPDDWWVDDTTGEYVNAETGMRYSPNEARKVIREVRDPDYDDLTAFMLQRIEDGDLDPEDIHRRLVDYGLMAPSDFAAEMKERLEMAKEEAA